jgi:hypothetical protein
MIHDRGKRRRLNVLNRRRACLCFFLSQKGLHNFVKHIVYICRCCTIAPNKQRSSNLTINPLLTITFLVLDN